MIGLVLQVEALGGFLAGIILSGQLLAVFMSNAGGAWDNAKKSIEDEPRDLKANTGKGSERHKAGVVGDTVGDPIKDTAGPALNPMIKVANLVSLLAAPIIVKYQLFTEKDGVNFIVLAVVVLLLAATIWAIAQSNRQVKTAPVVARRQCRRKRQGAKAQGKLCLTVNKKEKATAFSFFFNPHPLPPSPAITAGEGGRGAGAGGEEWKNRRCGAAVSCFRIYRFQSAEYNRHSPGSRWRRLILLPSIR